MHNNYYVLKRLSASLDSVLHGAVVSECFSQSLDELVLRLETNKGSFYIRAGLLSHFQCLSFPSEYHRARRNSVDLFPDWIGRHVETVRQFSNERSFSIELEGARTILFKMHGVRSNVIDFAEGRAIRSFKSRMLQDMTLRLEELDRTIDWSYESFVANQSVLEKNYFTFGKPVWNYLAGKEFQQASIDDRWKLIQETLHALDVNDFFIIEDEHHLPRLTLLPVGEVLSTHKDPIQALNSFSSVHAQVSTFTHEKALVLRRTKEQIEKAGQFIADSQQRLKTLQTQSEYKNWADHLMANLYAIRPGDASLVVDDFQTGKQLTIPLKKGISPQATAELYYRKAKNQTIEIKHLTQRIHERSDQLEELKNMMSSVEAVEDLKSLRKTNAAHQVESNPRSAASVPYREVVHDGFRIWIGKNASANDELTLKYGYKEDLWLHARDVAGSHVLIKHQAGKTYPKDVIERAAQLAAFFSKRKTETLCPVAYTPRKFVRKRKGDPPGSVVVEREKVILVEPKGIA